MMPLQTQCPQENVVSPTTLNTHDLSKTSETTCTFAPLTTSQGGVIGYTPQEAFRDALNASMSGFNRADDYNIKPVRKMISSTEGDVHFKRSETSGRVIVVKHTNPKGEDNGFPIPNEVRIARRLKAHPKIVGALKCTKDVIDKARHFVYMQYCDGGDLWDQMNWFWEELKRATPEVFFLHVAVELFEAFAWLHHGLRYVGEGKYTKDQHHVAVVHGDVKPENVFLRWGQQSQGGLPEIVIGDFGASKFVTDHHLQLDAGTQMYHAPEDKELYDVFLENSHDIKMYDAVNQRKTPASDIYAIGLILHQLAENKYDPLAIGVSQRDIQFSHGYRASWINRIIQACLLVPAEQRATADSASGTGVLAVVDELRGARDELVREGPPMSSRDFRSPRRPAPRMADLAQQSSPKASVEKCH